MLATLAEFSWSSMGISLSIVGFLFICVILILAILIQKPQGGGLAGAFGSSAGSSQTAFGAKTGDALTIATIVIFVFFTLGAIGMNYVTRPSKAVTPAEATATTTGPATNDAPTTPFTESPGNVTTTPVVPAPAGSTPTTTTPAAPAPAPTEPAPTQPAPTQPAPTQPAPTQPAPTTPEKPAGSGGN